jgi:hypothetical protein
MDLERACVIDFPSASFGRWNSRSDLWHGCKRLNPPEFGMARLILLLSWICFENTQQKLHWRTNWIVSNFGAHSFHFIESWKLIHHFTARKQEVLGRRNRLICLLHESDLTEIDAFSNYYTHRIMLRIYGVRRWCGLKFHDLHGKFLKDCFSSS